MLVANNKWNLQAKIRILKNSYWHHGFDSFPIIEDFCDESEDDDKCGNLGCCVMKCISIFVRPV